ncbi:hypothetical protein M0R72_19680 [Candidatus Pacearchaeota archaeon]|jgi:PHP family Zn ribbon phosphoesterase|nr:hypothetical protein [Candidatus Pacearchaeota archaeon]
MTTKEEHEFETKQMGASLVRQIDQITKELGQLKTYIAEDLPAYEHNMPQQALIDLAIRYGEWVAMKRIEVV